MNRRQFLGLAASAVTTWSQPVRAQQSAIPVIGFFGTGTPSALHRRTAAFLNRLRELNWIEGRNVRIEYRRADERNGGDVAIAAELVRLKVDVIVTQGTPSVLAAKQATSVIPIVFASAGDPVGTGLVKNLAHPEGNVTGLSSQATDSAPKRLELLRGVVPNLRTLAIMANVDNPFSRLEMSEVQQAATTLGLSIASAEIRRTEDIVPAFSAIKGRAEALFISTDPLLMTNLARINTLAESAHLPTIGSWREFVEAGTLMSYGSDITEQFRRAADLVDKILRGTKPADIPVAQPTKFEFVVNLKTARAIGLTVPPTLLALADEVIE